jgi:hypothetical protein
MNRMPNSNGNRVIPIKGRDGSRQFITVGPDWVGGRHRGNSTVKPPRQGGKLRSRILTPDEADRPALVASTVPKKPKPPKLTMDMKRAIIIENLDYYNNGAAYQIRPDRWRDLVKGFSSSKITKLWEGLVLSGWLGAKNATGFNATVRRGAADRAAIQAAEMREIEEIKRDIVGMYGEFNQNLPEDLYRFAQAMSVLYAVGPTAYSYLMYGEAFETGLTIMSGGAIANQIVRNPVAGGMITAEQAIALQAAAQTSSGLSETELVAKFFSILAAP